MQILLVGGYSVNVVRAAKKYFLKLTGAYISPREFPEVYDDTHAILIISKKDAYCQLYARRFEEGPLNAIDYVLEASLRQARSLLELLGMVTTLFAYDSRHKLLVISDSQELLSDLSKSSAIASLTITRRNICKFKKVRRCSQ